MDTLPPVAAALPVAASGSAATFSRRSERQPIEQLIDVDDPVKMAKLATTSVGALSVGGRLQPTRELDGLLGKVLQEQKIEIQNEETEAARASTASDEVLGAPIAGAGESAVPQASCAGGGVLGEAAVAANRAREAVVAAISQDRNQQLQIPGPPCEPRVVASISCGRSDDEPSVGPVAPILDFLADWSGRSRAASHELLANAAPRTMEMPSAQRSLFPSDPRRLSLPRRPRRSFKLRAAVMSALPRYVPRMYVDPPTPPEEGSPAAAGFFQGSNDGEDGVADGDDELDYFDGKTAPGDGTIEVGGANGDVHSDVDRAANAVGTSGASPTKSV